MPATGGQKLRLLYLMQLFLEKTDEEHPITVPQMIDALAARGLPAERRSLYDDIKTLRLFGMDIVTSRSRTVGYFLGSREFELAELKLLVDAVQASRFITLKKSRELIKKLERLTSAGQASQLSRQVYVAGRVKAMNESIYYNIDELHRAISLKRQISFQYYEYTLDKELRPKRGGERYTVSPYLLSWDDENYYLVAYHERYGGLSHFRVDKMAHICVEEKPVRPLERELDAADYAKRTFGMVVGDEQQVTVEFDRALIGVILDRFGKETPISATPDGNMFTAQLCVAVSPAFFAWLFQFGAKARILSPEPVARAMHEHLAQTLARYAIE